MLSSAEAAIPSSGGQDRLKEAEETKRESQQLGELVKPKHFKKTSRARVKISKCIRHQEEN